MAYVQTWCRRCFTVYYYPKYCIYVCYNIITLTTFCNYKGAKSSCFFNGTTKDLYTSWNDIKPFAVSYACEWNKLTEKAELATKSKTLFDEKVVIIDKKICCSFFKFHSKLHCIFIICILFLATSEDANELLYDSYFAFFKINFSMIHYNCMDTF